MALVILVGVGWVSHHTTTRLIEDTAWVAHTHEVLGSLQEVLSQMKDTETGQRGYLITGQARYLEPYHQALEKVHQSIADLRQLTADNPGQQQQLDILYPLVEEKLDELKETIDLRREEGFGPAARVVLTERGKNVMDKVRNVIAVMENEERKLLAERDAQAKALTQMTTRTLLIGKILSFALLLSVFYLLNLEVGQRIRAEEEIRRLNQELEQRVVERTGELHGSQKLFQTLATVSPVGIIRTNAEGHWTYVNQRWCEMAGLTPEEAHGEGWARAIHPEDHERVFAEWYRTAPKGSQFNSEYRLQRPDGVVTWVFTQASAEKTKDGEIIGYVGTITDVTNRKWAEELKRSNADLEQFASAASHDMQEPLRTISSFAQLLAKQYKGKLGKDADEFITYISEGAYRMQALIQDLLTYSRLSTQGESLKSVEVSKVVDHAMHNLRIAIEESQAEVSRDSLPVVQGDPAQLAQLFQNLIGNALKFRGEKPPRIHIRAESNGQFCTLAVKDNGIGIDPKFGDRIFAIFQRLHTRDSYDGTGIGLALCKKIVESHRGRIWMESQPREGTTFYFTLPLEEK